MVVKFDKILFSKLSKELRITIKVKRCSTKFRPPTICTYPLLNQSTCKQTKQRKIKMS